MTKTELMHMAELYDQHGEPELAKICLKSAKYMDQKEKSADERSA
jgi:hypothetical protein